MVVSKTEGIMAQTFREHWLDWLVAVVLLGLFGLAVGGSRVAFSGSDTSGNWLFWWDGFLQNSGTEMLGAFLTFILLEVIRGSRERKIQEDAEKQRTEDLKELQRSVGEQLQEQMRGFVQAQEVLRLRAAQTPEERQPILDSMEATGLLQGANLIKANLEGANLERANLEGANLREASLQGARLIRANLQGANLWEAKLQGANLWEAKLQGANLFQADLQRAHLRETNLQGANLDGAYLQGANLRRVKLQGAKGLTVVQLGQAKMLEGATLPDGTTLPDDSTWDEAFETWCETVETDEDGYIKPADLPAADPDADE
jgi:hypothetical protein